MKGVVRLIQPMAVMTLLAMVGTACVPAERAESAARSSPEAEGMKPVELAQLADGGYTLKGPYGFNGTLTHGDKGPWTLKARFVFPTAGYSVGEVKILVEKTLPEHVMITVPVTVPPKDAALAQAQTEEPVTETIAVSHRATFEVHIAVSVAEN